VGCLPELFPLLHLPLDEFNLMFALVPCLIGLVRHLDDVRHDPLFLIQFPFQLFVDAVIDVLFPSEVVDRSPEVLVLAQRFVVLD
jgi:hypothetical protein